MLKLWASKLLSRRRTSVRAVLILWTICLMTLVGCSHQATILKIDAPNFNGGFSEVGIYGEEGLYERDMYCLEEEDMRELWRFLNDVNDSGIIK